MTESDVLQSASVALRRASAPESDGRDTRARLLHSLVRRRAQRTAIASAAAALIVLFGGTTAWAAVTGRIPAIVQDVRAIFTGGRAASKPSPPPRATEPRRGTRSAVTAGSPVTPPVSTAEAMVPTSAPIPEGAPTPPVTPALPVLPAPRPPPHIRDVTTREAPPPPTLAPDDLYATAHDAHFRSNDASAALTAWDRYLAAEPQGRFELEARFNRAVALIRLARWSDARAALEPFAAGLDRDYRKSDAEALLARIDGPSTE